MFRDGVVQKGKLWRERRPDDAYDAEIDFDELKRSLDPKWRFNPRRKFSRIFIDCLAADLQNTVQYSPIILRESDGRYKYEGVAHETLFKAFDFLRERCGKQTVKIRVFRKGRLSDAEAMVLALASNNEYARGKPLTPVEEGLHIKKLMDEYGFSTRELESLLGMNHSTIVQKKLLVERGSEELRKALDSGLVNTNVAKKAVNLPPEAQKEFVDRLWPRMKDADQFALIDQLSRRPKYVQNGYSVTTQENDNISMEKHDRLTQKPQETGVEQTRSRQDAVKTTIQDTLKAGFDTVEMAVDDFVNTYIPDEKWKDEMVRYIMLRVEILAGMLRNYLKIEANPLEEG